MMTEDFATFQSVNKAFSKQSTHFDQEDLDNPILQELRQQVYNHVEKFIKPKSRILELNAGTGIDAIHFVKTGHVVHATDLSDGMIQQIIKKIETFELQERLTVQQISFEKIDNVNSEKFDFVFSNFGGLNCIDDLSKVTRHLPRLLNQGAYITWVIMPPVCLWEMAGVFKGNFASSLRRLNKNGVRAHLEGESFQTYYHSLKNIRNAFGPRFTFVCSEGLAALTPPPYKTKFPETHKFLYSNLKRMDDFVRKTYPFNRWADHIITTFVFNG